MQAVPEKMPMRLADVQAQIVVHPKFSTLSDGTRFTVNAFFHTNTDRESKKWLRDIWQHLYAGGKFPDH